MEEKKIKIGFEIVDSWKIDIFRNYIEKLQQMPEIELYLISNEPNSRFIDHTLKRLKIPESRYYRYDSFGDKAIAIDTFDLNIFLESDPNDFSKLVNLSFVCYSVYIDPVSDKHYGIHRFIVETDDYIEIVKNSLNILV